jgi:hypothetical protein
MGRFLQGIGEMPIWALAPAMLSLQYADTKGKVIGLYNVSLHLHPCFSDFSEKFQPDNDQPDVFALLYCRLIAYLWNLRGNSCAEKNTEH